MERTCKQCGGTFTLTPEEIAFYQSKNLQLPKRCEQCRKENKAKAGYTPAQQTVRPYYGKKKESGKWWAAAAAVLVLLLAGIGIFQSGRLFERDATGKVQGVSAETAVVSPEADVSTEDSESGHFEGTDVFSPDILPEVSEKADDFSGAAEDIQLSEKSADVDSSREQAPVYAFYFRKAEYLQEHFEKHGAEFGYTLADEYLEGANRVIASSEALHKLEAEDGDDVYYLEATNEFVIVSTDGYLRTYFKPEDGRAYYDRQ